MYNEKNVAYSYDYSRVESFVSGFVEQWKDIGFDAVVAVARGGLVPATMAATALGLPLHAVAYSRADRQVGWFTADKPRAGARILLVEDIAGRGTTLIDSLAFLQAQGYGVKVFTLAYDAQSRMVPDFGMKMPENCRAWFPWERESITETFGRTNNTPAQPEYTYASWAIDMDGVLLADLPDQHYEQELEKTLLARDVLPMASVVPGVDFSTVTIITGRPEQDRARTQDWLHRHSIYGPLVMRNEAIYKAPQSAAHKADAIISRGHTHFIESDSRQALYIANCVKVAKVIWWNDGKAMEVFANSL